jgi:hypothetical protein
VSEQTQRANEEARPSGSEPSAATDWQAEYCRVHAELQGAYAEISSLRRESAENRQAYERTFARLRDIELDDLAASGKGDAA